MHKPMVLASAAFFLRLRFSHGAAEPQATRRVLFIRLAAIAFAAALVPAGLALAALVV